MKLINSSAVPSHFLRRMVSWITKQYGMKLKTIRQARFTKTQRAWRGRAWSDRTFLVRINTEYSRYPVSGRYKKTGPPYTFADYIEALVHLSAHEICHVDEFSQRAKIREAQTEAQALKVLNKFREQREELLASWGHQVAKPITATVSIVDKREAKASVDLERWQRKLKLAKSKVAKYQQRVRYYDRKKEQRYDHRRAAAYSPRASGLDSTASSEAAAGPNQAGQVEPDRTQQEPATTCA